MNSVIERQIHMEIENLLIKKILYEGTREEKRTLFSFNSSNSEEQIRYKFNLFSRYFFINFFPSGDADFHKEMDMFNIKVYLGHIDSFLNICFRGAAKTTRTKLFIAFCVANDMDHYRKYIKILSKDSKNSSQFVTDIYNLLINPRVRILYPDIFAKTSKKREETMSSFSTTTGIKITAGTVGQSQRGHIQNESRPDFIIFDDFEDRMTLRSVVTTQAIFYNSEEARNGLSKNGGVIYLGNYISERGNVHRLVQNIKNQMIVPIIKDGFPTWDRYTLDEIKGLKETVADFEGEYLCQPSAGKDIVFDREQIDKMDKLEPIRDISGFRIYKKYDSSHRYASGHDVAGGLGLDSSTSVFIDFSTIPAQVVATYDNNEIKPDIFGDEIKSQADRFGECLVAPEKNNYGYATIARLKQIYPHRKIHKTQLKATKIDDDKDTVEYGWHTNALTKPKMLFDFSKAVADGLIALNCPKLILEARAYTRNDLMDGDEDVRLSTRHFDLLIAASIAWQMKSFKSLTISQQQRDDEFIREQIRQQTDFDQFEIL